ncbi:putative bifunctional diguanylate cyclase/phosphodiesterase [Phyllobacterium leguminum]|uniref:Diguanylate cyclase (GGDEF)-like protein n=1 Tax=Phyllobacterium leguminum TaxID=314237 RepID=A0A318T576_9HYPH|nr:bifunctional diguanylate cyclase/phosphodiesterase [Phyllobacterium leguminum]PYE89355.1 diguanylate cyclase (GGDEF)-like protein [Phyllobacterium leguminum]
MFFKASNKFRLRELERAYLISGLGLGALLAASGFLIDTRFRLLMGLAGDALATFTGTIMHFLMLFLPFILGGLFRRFGHSQQRYLDQMRRFEQAEELTRRQAHSDMLTGLFNRTYLAKAMEEGLSTGQWETRRAHAYLLDLDDFKHINDTMGHMAGDHVLISVAGRLKQTAVDGDVVVRLGGDEFFIVHFLGSSEQDASNFADRLITAVTQPIPFGDAEIIPNTSIGIARIGHDGKSRSDILRCADLALYEAKGEPVSAYRFYSAELQFIRDHQAALETEMRLGIMRGEFEVYYQPIYSVSTGRLRSFEALLRWKHPERGMISPVEFIPIAERSGMIIPIGQQVLRDACRAAATWPSPVGVSVNLSVVQFKDCGLVGKIEEALRESGLSPDRLDLEITESLLLEPSPRVISAIERVRELGIHLTMDDFGTGFSSLNNLRRFRFDRLKIDRSFTRDLEKSDSAEIIKSMISLSKALQMEATLEGVENETQLAFARNEGATEVQGFYYAKPMTVEDVAVLLREHDGAVAA